MTRVLFSFMVGAFLLALPGSALVSGKAHVPVGMVQVCDDDGEVKNIKAKDLREELDDGGCRLTACVFNETDETEAVITQFVFFDGDDCDNTDVLPPAAGDGFCDATQAFPFHLSAIGITPACTNPF